MVTEFDYPLANTRVGFKVRFVNHHVVGLAVTEISNGVLADGFLPGNGLARHTEDDHNGIITVPKIQLNPGEHYKILSVLQRGQRDEPCPRRRSTRTSSAAR